MPGPGLNASRECQEAAGSDSVATRRPARRVDRLLDPAGRARVACGVLERVAAFGRQHEDRRFRIGGQLAQRGDHFQPALARHVLVGQHGRTARWPGRSRPRRPAPPSRRSRPASALPAAAHAWSRSRRWREWFGSCLSRNLVNVRVSARRRRTPRAPGARPAPGCCASCCEPAASADSVVVVASSRISASSDLRFSTITLIRRFSGSSGSALFRFWVDARPSTRSTFASPMPPAISSRRDAFARSADSSQLL